MHIFTYFVPSIAINMLLLRERIPHKYADVIPETLQRVWAKIKVLHFKWIA